jgi:hypothetical protein
VPFHCAATPGIGKNVCYPITVQQQGFLVPSSDRIWISTLDLNILFELSTIVLPPLALVEKAFVIFNCMAHGKKFPSSEQGQDSNP